MWHASFYIFFKNVSIFLVLLLFLWILKDRVIRREEVEKQKWRGSKQNGLYICDSLENWVPRMLCPLALLPQASPNVPSKTRS